MPLTPSLKKLNYLLNCKSARVLDSKPESFSLIGYILIIVGLGFSGGLGLLIIVGWVFPYSEYFFVIPIGESTMIVGAIFAAAGFVVGHLRPSDVRKT